MKREEMVAETAVLQVSPFRAHLCLDHLVDRDPVRRVRLEPLALP